MRLLLVCLFAGGLFAAPDVFDAIRAGDVSVIKSLPVAARADGTTPLMHAVVTADAAMVKLLLENKADVRAVNSGGYTALHYALSDLEKTRLLLAAGADANAAAKNGLTPLRIAASRKGSVPFIAALLAAGAKADGRALEAASEAGEPAAMLALMKAGAALPAGSFALSNAAVVNCMACAPLLVNAGANVNQVAVRGQTALQNAAAYQNLEFVRFLLDQGAEVNPQCPRGYSALMRAAIAYNRNPAVVQLLLARGARTDLKEENGLTALTLAYRFGESDPIVRALRAVKAPGAAEKIPVTTAPAKTAREAVARALPILQGTAPAIWKTRGCVSCHSNSVPDMVTALAKKQGLAVDEAAAKRERKVAISTSSGNLPGLLTGLGVMGGPVYLLNEFGFDSEPFSKLTDATAHKVMFRQDPDGKWDFRIYRPPSEYSYISATALAVMGLKQYHAPGRAAEVKERVARGGAFLLASRAVGVEEQAMRLMGLAACDLPVDEAMGELMAAQRRDGSFSQLPGMAPDAYATGLALYALHTAGGMKPSFGGYQAGVNWLLRTQFPDGSWYVQTHTHPLQPYFESGFPYGHHQWISAAGTSWASLALLFANGEEKVVAAE